MGTPAEVVIRKAAATAVRRGHPWIWADAVVDVRGDPAPGDVVAIGDGDVPLGAGYYDPGAAIRVRVLSHLSQAGPEVDLDLTDFGALVSAAAALRARDPRLRSAEALRLVHGECDYAPGLVIDRYGDALVARYDGAGAAALWGRLEPRLRELAAAAGFVTGGLYVRGRGVVDGALDLESPRTIAEGAARFEVDLERGHKTGLFLDQRPHRERVGSLAAGRTVLNLFGYTGGFSIHAHLGGARQITTVDIAAPAIEAARRNIAASGLDAGAHRLITGDVFEVLRDRPGRPELYDIVVCDPPSFAPSRKAAQRGARAYRDLNRLAAGAVARGGLLVTASCSSHIRGAEFDRLVAEALADAGRRGRVIERGGPGPDHPRRPGFAEGDYLDVAYLALD